MRRDFRRPQKWYAEEFSKRSGLRFAINLQEPPSRLPPAMEIALFRVLQESLTNIHRHAKSNSVQILFEVRAEQAALAVNDDGGGVPADVLARFQSSGTSGVGLAGMRERIRELGGKFEVASNGKGTRVKVTVPLAQAQALAAEQSS